MTMLETPPAETPLNVTKPRRRGSTPNRAGQVLRYIALAVLVSAVLLPFYWMLSSSLKANSDVFTIPVKWFPDTVVWSNYVDIWQKSDMTT